GPPTRPRASRSDRSERTCKQKFTPAGRGRGGPPDTAARPRQRLASVAAEENRLESVAEELERVTAWLTDPEVEAARGVREQAAQRRGGSGAGALASRLEAVRVQVLTHKRLMWYRV